jgi:hypothetical protein
MVRESMLRSRSWTAPEGVGDGLGSGAAAAGGVMPDEVGVGTGESTGELWFLGYFLPADDDVKDDGPLRKFIRATDIPIVSIRSV